MVIVYLILLAAFGLVMHWAKLFVLQQTVSNFIDYLFVHHAKRTVLTVIALITTMEPILAHAPEVLTVEFGYSAFFTGFALDSAVNKGLDKVADL